MTHSILRIPAAKARSGYSRSTIYLRIAQGLWTKPVSLGLRAVGWLVVVTIAAALALALALSIELERGFGSRRRTPTTEKTDAEKTPRHVLVPLPPPPAGALIAEGLSTRKPARDAPP